MLCVCLHKVSKLMVIFIESLVHYCLQRLSCNLYISGCYVLIFFNLPARLKSYALSMLVQMQEIVTVL